MNHSWSSVARSVWGKTDRDSGSSLPVVQHLEDSAAVAGHLWDTWVAPAVRDRLGSAMGGVEEARTLTCWLAGIHDCGKASPAFAQKARDVGMGDLVDAMDRAGLSSPTLPRPERLHHSLTGQVVVHEWLVEQHGYSPSRAQALASVIGAHHGAPPQRGQITSVRRTRALGDEAWDEVRSEVLTQMTRITQAGPVIESLRDRKLSLPTLIDLSALVIIADWIASDSDNFPYDCSRSTAERLVSALPYLDLRSPWGPDPVDDDARTLFAARFPRLRGTHASELQVAAVDLAAAATEVPMLVIEAPTGSGKTEAALLAAEVLAARFGAGGVFVGLPTMATSNAMFGRVMRWVEAWPDAVDPTVWLAHGKAALNEDFAGLVRVRAVRAVYDDEDGEPDAGSARVSSWLAGRKKGLLANVVVGTIDQVLLGALQARHLALRHLALSSKVLVVDEVHAADTHMRSFLVRMLDYLGSYGTPVILLSATLPPQQRAELITAYQSGRRRADNQPTGGLVSRPPRGSVPSPSAPPPGPGPEQYPLITTVDRQISHRVLPAGGPAREVQLERCDDDIDRLCTRLRAELSGGGCAAVVRNTVRRAQETFDVLQGVFGDEVRLFHSRFLACDRAARERHLTSVLGPEGERPHRLIVVGTQVLEQSLDIDVDVMVTDLAPVDLMVQRLGRLHRHVRSRPVGMTAPRCLVVGVDWAGSAPVPVESSTRVYEGAPLLRSLAVLRPFLNEGEVLELPEHGPHLVHAAYDPGLRPPPGWEAAWKAADQAFTKLEAASREKAKYFQIAEPGAASSLVDWTSAPADDGREEVARAQVRDSEDGIEVVVVRRDESGDLHAMPGASRHADRAIPYQPDDREGLTKHLAACTVGLPQALTQPWAWEQTVIELERFPEGDRWQGSRWLRGQLPLVLDDTLTCQLNGHRVSYDAERGLDVTRIDRTPS